VVTFTEFYCHVNGSNLNSGSDDHNTTAARFTYSGGSWVASTGVFTVASGDPAADGVVVGDFASVYASGATVTGFVGRVTARDATTITVSLTVKAGTAPVDGSGSRVLKIGGCWKGPNGAEDFPFAFMHSVLNDGTNLVPRVNLKGTFTITGSINHSLVDEGPLFWSGYLNTAGDGEFCLFDGNSGGGAFTILFLGGSTCRRQWLTDCQFVENGSSGTATQVSHNSTMGGMRHCRAIIARGIGFQLAGAGATYIELEAASCNFAGGADVAAISIAGNCRLIRCAAANNYGHGIGTTTANSVNAYLTNCVAKDNGESGFIFRAPQGTAGGNMFMQNCDSFSNTNDGLEVNGITAGGTVTAENCNFFDNAGWGVNQTDALDQFVYLKKCAFGSGTMANDSGNVNVASSLVEEDSVNYQADQHPYVNTSNLSIVSGTEGFGEFSDTYQTNVFNLRSYGYIGAVPGKRAYFVNSRGLNTRR
jgi:hypothetical protein